MAAEALTDVVKYCFLVRSESVPSIFKDEPETSNYQVEDRDFLRFVDGLKKPYGREGLLLQGEYEKGDPREGSYREGDYELLVDSFKKPSGQDMLMEQLCYAQPADCAQKLSPVSGTQRTIKGWFDHQHCYPYSPRDTLYLHERRDLSVFDVELSRNGLPFLGYLQKHCDDYTRVDDESFVGAVTMKGKLLLRESTPICVPNIALFTATLDRGVLRIVRLCTPFCLTRRGSSQAIYAGINMILNKQEFERGIRTVNKLRMAAAEFRNSVAASVGDPSTYDVAPDDWMPLQERLFSFPETSLFAKCISAYLSDTMLRSVEPRTGDEEFHTLEYSRWTDRSECFWKYAQYAIFSHRPIHPSTTTIPLTKLRLDLEDPKYELYDGYVPSNCFILVREDGDRLYEDRQKLIANAMNFVDFAEDMTQLVEKQLPCHDNLAAFFVEVRRGGIDIMLLPLRGSRPGAAYSFIRRSHFLISDKESFELALRALALVRKTAAEIRRRLCADVAARRSGEIHVPAQPDCMEVSRSEEEEICKVSDTMAQIDLGAEVASRDSAPMDVETNTACQRGQKRGRDEDEDEAPQTMKHRRIIKTMPQARQGADVGSVGLAAADTKANSASQDDRRRRQDDEEGENTGTMLELRPEGVGIFGSSAPVDTKANPASQDGQNRRRDEDEGETPRTVTTGTVTTGTMIETRPGGGSMFGGGGGSIFGGPVPVDINTDPTSQDGQNRKQDKDMGETPRTVTPRTVTTGTTIETRPGGSSMFGGGGGSIFGGPVPVDIKTNPTSQDVQNRKQDENKGETPQAVTTGTTRESQPSGGPAPLDMKANPSSQTGRKRRRDEDEGETPRTVTTGGGIFGDAFGGVAPVDEKASPSSQTGRKRRRDEEEDDVTHLTEKYRRLGLDSSSRKKVRVEGDHDA